VHNRGYLQLPEKIKADRSIVLRLTGSWADYIGPTNNTKL
jgi:hypothetical protein